MSPQHLKSRIAQASLVSPNWTPKQSQKGEMNMAKKRGNNEGTVYKRKDGRWCAQVSLSGKRITKYAKTQRECHDWVREITNKIEHGMTFDATQLTLECYMQSWLTGKDLSIRQNTARNYRRYAEQDILPVIGKMRLQNILPAHIRQLYLRMQAEGKGSRTIQLVHATLHCALKQAVKERLIGYNPMDAVERPKVETKEFHIFTESQARTFLEAASGHPSEALFYLALTTGLRKGELLGLMWEDVDWDKGTLRVERQLQQAYSSSAVLVPTKTRSGRRQIKLGKMGLAMLEAHRHKQEAQKTLAGDSWKENGMIFTTGIGTYASQSKVSKEFKRILWENNLPDIRFHDLRHTSISLLLDMGTPINTVQHRAGHSKASVTTDIYGHVMAHSQDAAAENIEQIVKALTNVSQ
jgi:integrase